MNTVKVVRRQVSMTREEYERARVLAYPFGSFSAFARWVILRYAETQERLRSGAGPLTPRK